MGGKAVNDSLDYSDIEASHLSPAKTSQSPIDNGPMNNPRGLRSLLIATIALATIPVAHAQQIAITWDDLPAHSALPQGETRLEIGHKLIAAMKEAHLPTAYGFVNAVAVEREAASAPMFKDWHDAGFPLGNHTWSHINLNTSSVADWEADLLKNEPVL